MPSQKAPYWKNALIDAMTSVNAALMPWQAKKEQAGYPNLAILPVPRLAGRGTLTIVYTSRALFSTAFCETTRGLTRDTDTSNPSTSDSAKAAG